MDLGLAGRVALVTGGASGIGAAIAGGLAREGCDVAIVDRSAAEGTVRAVESCGCRALGLREDVRDFAAATRVVGEVVGRLGRLDILVCDAGITGDATLANMTEEQWDCVIDVNLKGVFNYNRAVAAHFAAHPGGRIVNIASINGLRGKFGQTNYAASKGGVIALTRSVARELGRHGVNVNAVAPGMVLTDMARALPGGVLERATGESLLGRLATPEDCADLVVFLCSERARHITGAVLPVDGGQYLGATA